MDFGALLETYGLPGVIIFALGCVVVYQEKAKTNLYTRLFEIQEARRQESLETAKELNTTLQTFSQSTKMLVDKIKIARGDDS